MTGSGMLADSGVHQLGVLRGRLVRPLALLAVTWAAACGGDGGTTEPEPAPQPNRPPAASGSIPAQTMTAGESATVSVGGLFSDPDGDALTFTAISSNAGVASVALSGTDLTITAVAAGSATVTVTARDPAGLSTAASTNVTVMEPNRAPLPQVPVAPTQTAIVGDTLNIDVSPFFTDPDGDALTYSAASANASVATVTVAGSVVSAAAVGAGSTTLTVTATDPDGLSGSLSVPVTVEPNRPPETTQDSLPSLSIQERNSETVNVAQYFTDPNGQALTYTAESDDPTVATVSVSGSTMTVTAGAIGTATVTVTATDPYDLTASVSGTVTVIERVNRAPEAQTNELDPIARTAGWTQTVDLEGDDPLFVDPDGDDLAYSAESSDAGVVSATVSGSDLTLTAVAVGKATITITATDPGGLSASLSFEFTVLPDAGLIFRDDFDDEGSLEEWGLILARAAVSEGTLQLTSDSAGYWGIAVREQDPPITSWEIRVRLARARADSMWTSIGFSVANPDEEFNFQWFRLDIGTRVIDSTDETFNYALAAFFTPPEEDEGVYYLPRNDGFRGVSEAINEGAGEFTEITIRVQDGRFEILADTETLFSSPTARWIFDSAVQEISEVHVWSIDPATTDPSLFDWIEVNGVPTESSATAGEFRSPTVVPMDVTGDTRAVREVSPRVVGEGPPRRSLIPGRR